MADENQSQDYPKEINEVISYDESLPIVSKDRNKLVKCLGSMSNLRAIFLLEIIRTSIYLFIAFGIFVFFEKSNRVTFREQNFFSSEQVVYVSEIRGLFPPMKGTETALMGKWKVSFTNSLKIGANDIFNNYTIEFKANNTLRIKRVACDGDLYMRWETFQYNIHISTYDFDKNDTMVIEPDENDTKCITENSTFFNHIRDVSVWTLEEEKLYILIEKWENNRTIQSILLLNSN